MAVLNQPLAVIQLNADMIELVLNDHEGKLNQDKSIDKAMTGLRTANQRAATIISTLRNMFGQGRKSISVFDFNELVKEVLLLCQPTLQSQSIDLQLHLHPQPLNITGDKSQLQQVILNLITNASEAFLPTFQGHKTLTLQTGVEEDRIYLTVADNGCGIAADIESQMFELLRTNKESGMGIGLWLSKTIVESHEGQISYTTAPDLGTCFRVALPSQTDILLF